MLKTLECVRDLALFVRKGRSPHVPAVYLIGAWRMFEAFKSPKQQIGLVNTLFSMR